ncbi:lysine transporter LysE [Microlunatus endophyticus]|uniref:Lysine transporter LysE n=1 Tax=Microlunatus endophyticus TaxID=1716077 RepID=A0A917SIJ0_9ACTN|nr:LysE family translocator [Microlunatus endophyticus]GGL84161.1 lysine transporter LysE [Microlunatus endophyticus]
MLTLQQVVGITLASVVLIAVPGPSVMFVVGRALSHGRGNALASVAGNAIGCYLVGAAIAVGLGPLLQRSETLFRVVKWVGILYLFWLGIQAIRHAGPLAEDAENGRTGHQPARAAIRTGVIVGLTNPKTFVLYTAIVPQFLNRAVGNTTVQMLVLGVVPLVIGLITDTGWALAAGRARTWLAKSPRRVTTIGRIGGASIIGVGLSVVATGDHR